MVWKLNDDLEVPLAPVGLLAKLYGLPSVRAHPKRVLV